MRQPAQPLHQESSCLRMHLPLVLFQVLLPHCDPSSPSRKPSSILLLHEYPPANHLVQPEPWAGTHHPVVVEAVVPEVHRLGALEVVGVRRCLA